MSKYTTEVRFICETNSGLSESVGANNVDTIISQSWDKIFTTKCKFFDEEYRKVLCSKILKHFYLREIGAETVGIWKLWMNTRLEEIMPYYNQLYKSELLEFNPLYDTNVTTTHNRKNSGETNEESNGNRGLTGKRDVDRNGNRNVDVTGSGEGSNNVDSTRNESVNGGSTNKGTRNETSNNSGTKRDLYSDTPQGALTGIESETYLTNARKITESGNGTVNITDNTEETNNSTTKETSNANGTESNSYKENTKETFGETTGTTYSENEKTTGTKTGSANSTEEYLENVSGKRGGESYSSMLLKYRDTFLNIDMLVIEEFNDLFLNLW